ncbi:MAG: ExeM/NucH family extracellular endonuclease [Microbacteriaceae bacterium]
MRRRTPFIASASLLALGLASLGAPPAFAADVTHSIADVQGAAEASPLAGQTVTVEGVVTADFRNASASGYKGFYLQTAGSGGATDATPGRSDGVFVYANAASPTIAIGDLVRVTGGVTEYQGQTQISATAASAYELLDASVGLPETTVLPTNVVGAEREAYEGMLVTPQKAVVASSHQLYNFGTLWLAVGDLPVKATESTDAGAAAAAIAAANRSSRLLLDDGYSLQVSNAAHLGGQPYFDAATVVRNGDLVTFPAAGMVLGYGFNEWRLQPQRPLTDESPAAWAALKPTFTTANPRTAAPENVGGNVSVGAFNVFNYFTTFGGNARGAANAAQFAIQQSKIVAAINALDADVVALMEIENSVKLGEEPDEALGNLVTALNAQAGAGTWAFVPTPTALLDAATTDFITNAIIYKTAKATPVGDSFADVDETVWDIAREPIAQTFTLGTGADEEIVTVVANHFKSKSPPKGNTAPEPADLQGFFNTERVEQATRLAQFVDGITADATKGENVIMLGDFNAYAEEDPSQVLTAAGYVDLVPTKTDEYTYTFDGELGSLDHAFVTPELAASVTGVDVWTINSPEWSDSGYAFAATEAGTPFRSSDHDPIKVGLSTASVPVNIDILSVNDFHGRLEASAPSAGAAVIGGMVNSFKAANPNSIFVGAGDFVGASTFTSFIQNDEPTIDALNAIGLETSAFGNHEFDQGRADVEERIIPHADWDYLSANIYDRATGEPAYQQFDLKEFDGVTVGFIGAMTEELPSLVSPDGIATLEVRPVVSEVNRVASMLSDGNDANGEADVIVLLVHEGAATTALASATDNSAFGRIVTGANDKIDAIVSGHTHLAYNHDIAIPGTDRTRPVLSSGQYGEKFSHMSLSVDPDSGDLLDISAEVLPLFGAYTPDPEVAAIVADAVAVAKVLGAVKVGDITADFKRAKQSAAGSENRGGESTLGNFVADVHLWATTGNGADLAVMNPGGVRADLKYASSSATDPDGNVTFAEAAAVQPFANTLQVVDLTGAQLKQVLEQQWQPTSSSRPFLKLGLSANAEYTYNPTAAAGSRITSIRVNGELVSDSDVFTVAANSFLAVGGDNFTAFADGTNRADTGKIDLQSMVDYFTANPVASPRYAQRAVGVVITPSGEVEAGDSVSLALSSLLFSNGEPTPTEVVVSAGGTQLATGTIDPAIVDTTDEVGRSTVQIVIPDGTPAGTLELTITVPGTETVATISLQVASSAVPIESVTAPVITGNARVGAVLAATSGTWSVASPTLAYQWNRDGAAIAGATAATYTVMSADAGASLTVTVTASAEGYTDGVATSAARTVQKIATSTNGSLARFIGSGSATVNYSVHVRAGSGIEPVGDVAIYDGTKKIATVTLVAGDNGRATVKLPALGRGVSLVTARFIGNDQLAASVGWPSLYLGY